MFGSINTGPSAFGGTPSSGFGSFAQPTFGQQAATSTSNFGGFGTTGFGQPTAVAGSMFGSNQAAAAPSAAANPFGGSSFGAPRPQLSGNTGGLFATGNQTGGAGLFGNIAQPTPTNVGLFGQQKPFGFSSTAQPTAVSNAGSGLFGTQSAQGMSFGSTPSSTTNLFGTQSSFQNAPIGTTVKFQPQQGTEQIMKNGMQATIQTRMQCVTGMKEYEAKSIEELRLEDYAANRKGGGGTIGGGLFGASQPSFSGMGTAEIKPMGVAQPMAFGSTLQTGTNMFGAASGTSSLFGNKSVFGGTSTTATPSFGIPTSTSASGSLFGMSQSQNKPLFGQQTGSGLFGQQPPQQTSFGSAFNPGTSTSAGLFGTAKPAFGAGTTTSSAPLFNFANTTSQASAPSLFGNKSTSNFGFAQPNTGGFGSQANAATGLFGNKLQSGFGFTSNTNQPAFGTGTFNFSNQTGAGFGQGQGLFGPGKPNSFETPPQDEHKQQIRLQLLQMSMNPYGDSPLFQNMGEATDRRENLLKPISALAQKSIISPATTPIHLFPKVKRIPVANVGTARLFDDHSEVDGTPFYNQALIPRRSYTKLTLKPRGSSSSDPAIRRALSDDENIVADVPSSTVLASQSFPNLAADDIANPTPTSMAIASPTGATPQPVGSSTKILESPMSATYIIPTVRRSSSDCEGLDNQSTKKVVRFDDDPDSRCHSTHSDSATTNEGDVGSFQDESDLVSFSNPGGVILRRSGYYTDPPLDTLVVDGNGKCEVDGLVIGRENYGTVYFPGITDVTNMNLDEIIHFRRKEVTVYPDDVTKPKRGYGLNKRAEITLHCCWPRDKTSKQLIKDPNRLKSMNYQDKIEQASLKIGAKFIDYRPETGSWVFEVDHFSKYGLQDSEDDEVTTVTVTKKVIATDNLVQKTKFSLSGITGNGLDLPDSSAEGGSLSKHIGFDGDIEMTDDVINHNDDISSEFNDSDVDRYQFNFSHNIVSTFDIPSEKVQLMKASMFVDEDNDNLPDTYQPKQKLSRYVINVDNYQPMETNRQDHSFLLKEANGGSFPEEDYSVSARFAASTELSFPGLLPTQPTAKMPLNLPTSIKTTNEADTVLVTNTLSRVAKAPYAESFIRGKEHNIADLGLFLGSTSRFGWGQQLQLVCATSDATPDQSRSILYRYDEHKETAGYTACLMDMTSATFHSEPALTNVVSLLKIVLNHSVRTPSALYPVFIVSQTSDLIQELVVSINSMPKVKGLFGELDAMMGLCMALWGSLPSEIEKHYSKSSYNYQDARREAFSKWLQTCSASNIHQEIVNSALECPLQIFSYLTGKQLGNACKTAQDNGYLHLALLLSQVGGSHTNRQYILDQLQDWAKTRADKFISEDVIKIYATLAGTPYMETSNGAQINACAGLDWRRAFSLHMWYVCPATASIEQCLEEYRKAFCGSDVVYARPPLPTYFAQSAEISMTPVISNSMWDTCFHLIALYCDNSYKLDLVVDNTGHTDNPLDFHISWVLSKVLESIGYRHFSDSTKSNISMGFLSQLEGYGMWEWAVFVALHNERADRRSVVEALLEHNCTAAESFNPKEEFVVDTLGVSSERIYKAKAHRAEYDGEYLLATKHYLSAKDYNRCHEVLLDRLIPTAMISGEYSTVHQLLVSLNEDHRRVSISNWNGGGKVYFDFLNIMASIHELKTSGICEADLEGLFVRVTELARAVSSLPPPKSPREQLCYAELASRAISGINGLVELLDWESDTKGCQFMLPIIQCQTVPSDISLGVLESVNSYCISDLLA